MEPKNQKNGTTNKKYFRLELVKTIVSVLLLLTVFFAYLQWRATIKNEAANRFLDIIDKLGNSECDSVRSGAVITMTAHLNENYEEYCNQSIPVLVSHLSIEPARQVRTKIVNILTSKNVDPNLVIGPLISEIRDITCQNGDKSSHDQLKYLVTGEQANENLLDMSKVLVAVLQKKPPEEPNLSGYFLMDWSPKGINWEQANLKEALLLRGSLRQSNLKNAILQGAELYEVDLMGAFLEKADISRAILRKVNLKEAKLNHVDLKSANLFSTDLRGADLVEANFTEAVVDANMEAANLHAAEMFMVDLTDSNLTDANLTSADLTSCKSRKASLKRANMRGAILVGAKILESNLADANLMEAKLMDATVVAAILERANLIDANLMDANLADANLANANLTGANLVRADLEGAILTNANLSYVNLTNANLSGADLSAANLQDADLKNATLKAKVLFRIDPNKFQNDLDGSKVSKALEQEFENKRFYLSQNTTISIVEKGISWLINDKDYERIYTVRRDGKQMVVCKDIKFDSFGIKEAKNWEQAIFDDDKYRDLSSKKD